MVYCLCSMETCQRWMEGSKSMELLDYLVELLGCAYLSDLHYRSFPAQQARAVLDIPDGRFPLEQYADAICYLLGEAPLPPDLASAKQALAAALAADRAER